MIGVEGQDIGGRAGGEPPRMALQRLRAADAAASEQRPRRSEPPGGARTLRARRLEPLRIFELPQFAGDADLDIGIRADAEAPAAAEIGARR